MTKPLKTTRRWHGSAAAALLAGFISSGAFAATPIPDASIASVGTQVAADWSASDVSALLSAVRSANAQGLNQDDYGADALKAAMAGGNAVGVDQAANATASALAHDFLFGRVSDRQASGWLIERSPYEAMRLPAAIEAARAAGRLGSFFAGLLPQDDRYAAMRAALAEASDAATRDRLRANMERARWMPRTVAQDYLYVNVPSYRLQVVSNGVPVSTYTVVVGAKETPTPLMITPTSSLVVNPWWNVPQSIVAKTGMRPGRAGFQFTRLDGSSWAVRQPPGPRNALGRIKFNLVNDQAIYLHDTPAKTGFARQERALSHGCIRVKNIDKLAQELVADDPVDGATLDAALSSTATATVPLAKTWPVMIVYFTSDLDETGRLVNYADPYGDDARVTAALDGGRAYQMAMRN